MLDQATMEARLKQCIGIVVGPQTGWDPVNQPMIRHWCDAMGDNNPLYTDPDFVAESGQQGVIAPPTMIQAWTMPGYTGKGPADSVGLAEGEDDHFELLTQGGFASVVAVNCDQEYFQPVLLGDEIHHSKMLESVSEHKKTALGEGYFTTELYRYFNQHDQLVATMRFRLLRFKPPVQAEGDR